MNHLSEMRAFFRSGQTREKEFRVDQLKKLRNAILQNEKEIYAALKADLGKSQEESWVTEIGMVISEIDYALRHLGKWMKPKKVWGGLASFPSCGIIYKEPLGMVLIISPWNYPFQLSMNPLVGAIAAGNCAVVKPSEVASATEKVIQKIIEQCFALNYVQVVIGKGETVIPELLDEIRFDHIFYTGSTHVGKKIYQLAAKDLIPVTLELGGKSPCIVESSADLKVAAKRIVFGKFVNAGQTCIAPDYLLVHQSVSEELLKEMVRVIESFYGEKTIESNDYGRIISEAHFERLVKYLNDSKILYGGNFQANEKWISPTIITRPAIDTPLMQEEIFGPILPVFTYEKKSEALAIIEKNPSPLSFYLFTKDKNSEKEWLQTVSFGGGCINNTLYQFANKKLPFGGIGDSGIGSYHGQYSFDIFTHNKPVVRSGTWFDPAFKYPPFSGKLNLLKKFI